MFLGELGMQGATGPIGPQAPPGKLLLKTNCSCNLIIHTCFENEHFV